MSTLTCVNVPAHVRLAKLRHNSQFGKGCIEEIFRRFPHIGEQIFGELDDNSLSRCLEVNKWWQKFIDGTKIRQINQIQSHTHIKNSVLKKELSSKDFETVQKLANYCMKVYNKVIIDSMKYLHKRRRCTRENMSLPI